ncbi:MAG TPA: hypothetical protein VI756_23340 [Blastocatellia bacterium]
MAVDSAGDVYVVNLTFILTYSNDAKFYPVQKFDSEGNFLGEIGSVGPAAGQLYFPQGIAVSPSGDVYVSDEMQRVQIFGEAQQEHGESGPKLSSAVYKDGILEIRGANFGTSPTVLVNNKVVSQDVTSESNGLIEVTGGTMALGLSEGENQVQIVNSQALASNTVSFSAP